MRKTEQQPEIDCLGLGILPFDLLYSVDRYPDAEMKIDATDLIMQGGGPVPNVSVGLSRLGFTTALIAAVGRDPFGRIGIDQLEKEGVDCRHVIEKKQPSAIATGWIEKGSGRRTMVLGRKIFVKPTDLKVSKYPVPWVLHLDGRDLEATLKLARWGKKVGAIISFDIGSVRNDVSPVFKYVEHLVVADSYAFHFTRSRNARNAINRLRDYCPGTIVITEGIKGVLGWNGDGYIYQPAYKVNTVDTTGAGDAFHTGYLCGLLQGDKLATCMKLGAAVAALKCIHPGARSGLPTRRELTLFLSKKRKVYRR